MLSHISSFHWLLHVILVAFLDLIASGFNFLFMRVSFTPHTQGTHLVKLNT